MTTFIGLDLAWNIDRRHSGIAVLVGDAESVRLTAVSDGIRSRGAVIDFIGMHASDNTVMAIDASLVVRNRTGQRPCETLVSKAFGAFHASCHTTNTARKYADVGPGLVDALERIGFAHDFHLSTAKQRHGRWIFELYPHPAMVRLFDLTRIMQYKKGSVATRRLGLRDLHRHIGSLTGASSGLSRSAQLSRWLDHDPQSSKGQSLKHLEDTLDAIFCGYVAWHCWRRGDERNEIYGTLAEGYIVVPRASTAAAGSS